MLDKKKLLGVGITNASKKDILEYVLKFIERKSSSMYIVTPNPEILVYANSHESFKKILNNAEISLADAVGLFIAGKLLKRPLKERFSGTDFVDLVCREVAKKPVSIGFLGARPAIAEKTAECLRKKYPGLKVGFVGSEWPYNSYNDYKGHKNYIVDILFVAFGFPKQEQWMAENKDKGYFRVAIGVGGAFDYIGGSVPRAPKLLQDIGGEWLFRLIVQPWRIKRQTALLKFLFLVLKEKFFQ